MRETIIVIVLVLVLAANAARLNGRNRVQMAEQVFHVQKKPAQKIIGGSHATQGAFPSVASLRDAEGKHICGGVYIGDSGSGLSYVLTTSQCFESIDHVIRLDHVIVGALDISGKDGQVHDVRFVIRNQEYYPSNDAEEELNTKKDVALVALMTRVTDIEPAKLPKATSSLDGEADEVTVVGWGHINEDGETSDVLQQADVTILASSDCSQLYFSTINMDFSFCAAVAEGAQDACVGDDGGPAFSKTKSNVVVGIVRKSQCGDPEIPSVYTRIAAFTPWIQSYLFDLQPIPKRVPAACKVANPSYIGDGKCDSSPEYNNAACGWDGGDCCEETCMPFFGDCTDEFYCIDPQFTESGPEECNVKNPSYLGDGYCDGAPYNTAECDWDGGDCCKLSCLNEDCPEKESAYDCWDPLYSKNHVPTPQPTPEPNTPDTPSHAAGSSRIFVLLEKLYDRCLRARPLA